MPEPTTAAPPRDNYGYLHRCPKLHNRAPEMTGQAWIGGQRYELAGWVNLSKRGKKYLTLKFSLVAKKGEHESAA
jgi:hypothetical protein